MYRYSTDDSRSAVDKHRGLLEYGPLHPARVHEPRCIFVFQENEREVANNLFLSLKNGIDKFPGIKRLTGLSIETSHVEALRIPEGKTDKSTDLFDLIDTRLRHEGRPDFAFILHGKQPSPLTIDPYHSAKAAFIKHGIPSQFVSLELLRSPAQFRFAVANIALSVFVKLGGVPWSVGLRRTRPTLVFGIGKAETRSQVGKEKRQLIGYATCVLSNGIYLNTTFFPAANTYTEFLEYLREGLRAALGQMLDSRVGNSTGVEKVSIHISQLEKDETVRVVREVVQKYATDESSLIPIEVVKITADSDFTVLDLKDPGYVSEEGSVVALNYSHALLVTEGRKEKSVWRGRKPVTLELRRTYRSSPSLNLRDTIEDASRGVSRNWCKWPQVIKTISDPRNEWRAGSRSAAS